MSLVQQRRICTEALIRRLHVSGFNGFLVRDEAASFRDTNVLAWINGNCVPAGFPDADLVALDAAGRPRLIYVFHLNTTVIAGAGLFLRLQNLRERARSLHLPASAIHLLISAQETTTPRPASAHLYSRNAGFDFQVDAIDLSVAALVFDYLRMSQRNIFNSSNTPTAPSLIAESLGLTEQYVRDACERLRASGQLEQIRVGDRVFFRSL